MGRADIIFVGPTGKLNVQQIARITGISPSTLYRWRREPDSIPAGELRILFKAVKLPPEKVIEFFE